MGARLFNIAIHVGRRFAAAAKLTEISVLPVPPLPLNTAMFMNLMASGVVVVISGMYVVKQ